MGRTLKHKRGDELQRALDPDDECERGRKRRRDVHRECEICGEECDEYLLALWNGARVIKIGPAEKIFARTPRCPCLAEKTQAVLGKPMVSSCPGVTLTKKRDRGTMRTSILIENEASCLLMCVNAECIYTHEYTKGADPSLMNIMRGIINTFKLCAPDDPDSDATEIYCSSSESDSE